MLKEVSNEDVDFIKSKYDLDQELSFLPDSFKEEADLYISQNGSEINNESCSRVYEELVTYFTQ